MRSDFDGQVWAVVARAWPGELKLCSQSQVHSSEPLGCTWSVVVCFCTTNMSPSVQKRQWWRRGLSERVQTLACEAGFGLRRTESTSLCQDVGTRCYWCGPDFPATLMKD